VRAQHPKPHGFLVILLMVFLDIHYLLENRDQLGPSIYFGVFKEIVFAFGVLLVLSLAIMGRYARNLRRTLGIQVRAMEEISRGQYDVQVPVLSNDEFGLIVERLPPDVFLLEPLGPAEIRGKAQAVEIYRLLSRRAPAQGP